MTHILAFTNPGEIDILAAVTLGVNVKPGDNPIGQFGTGLKYVIAGVLRLGGRIEIWSGEDQYIFTAEDRLIRGQPFQIVRMDCSSFVGRTPQDLGFTTDLGKHWTPKQLYRELVTNMMDEGGGGVPMLVDGEWDEIYPGPDHDLTLIRVDCPELVDCFHNHQEIFLDTTQGLLWLGDHLEIYPHEPGAPVLAYRGVFVADQIDNRDSIYTYNILSEQRLTEDRTLADRYSALTLLGKSLVQCPDPEICEAIVAAKDSLLEAHLDYDWHSVAPSAAMTEAVVRRTHQKKSVAGNLRQAIIKSARDRMEAAEHSIPEGDWDDMQAAAPEPAHGTRPTVSLGDLYDLERWAESAQNSARYWKAVAEELARRLRTIEEGSLRDAAHIQSEIGNVE